MELDIRIESGRLKEAFRAKGEEITSRLAQAGLHGGKVIQAEAKRRAPVDTGLLRRTIAVRIVQQGDELVVQIGTNVHYAIHVEYGHRTLLGTGEKSSRLVKKGGRTVLYVPGRYFLRNSLTVKGQAAIGAIVRALQKE